MNSNEQMAWLVLRKIALIIFGWGFGFTIASVIAEKPTEASLVFFGIGLLSTLIGAKGLFGIIAEFKKDPKNEKFNNGVGNAPLFLALLGLAIAVFSFLEIEKYYPQDGIISNMMNGYVIISKGRVPYKGILTFSILIEFIAFYFQFKRPSSRAE